jgi:hypothetical protein
MVTPKETGQPMIELLARCRRAVTDLYALHDASTDLGERSRLRAKAHGVNIAVSYVEEAIRGN